MRSIFPWRLRSRTLELGRRSLIMGILNVTPDSFSDGGRFFDPEKAVQRALDMIAEGADIIDIGGESTRPGTKISEGGVTAEEELRRVLPVIERLKLEAPDAVISVDTYKARVATEAAEAGAEIINDVSAMQWDAGMARAIAESGCGAILMHTRGQPEEWRSLPRLGGELVELVLNELRESACKAEHAGIAHERIVLDPGFGFGKNFDENYPLLARFEQLHKLGYPLLSATSRKSFIGRTLSQGNNPVPPDQRLYGTLATVTASILKGAHIVRVHDVGPAREAVAVADEILAAG